MNRRNLLLLGAATACPTIIFPTIAHALIIPPPPPSLWYLIFIRDGIYQISDFYIVTLPASAGTCQNYDPLTVSRLFAANFTFTGPHGISPWRMLTNAPSSEWWEVLDKRNGRIFRIWKYDRIEVKFADKSRVRVSFKPGMTVMFEPVVGTERLPDGSRLYPREDRRGTLGGEDKTREGSNTFVTKIKPPVSSFNWSYADQETPW